LLASSHQGEVGRLRCPRSSAWPRDQTLKASSLQSANERPRCELSAPVKDRIGNVRGAEDGERFLVHSPIDGSPLIALGSCGVMEAKRAVDGAATAFQAWKGRTAYDRSGMLRRWCELILEHENQMAELMSVEMGKPVTEAVAEVRYAASFVEWYAEEAKRVPGELLSSQHPNKRIHVIRQPSGVVYGITPWNFPLATVTRKAAPALAAGCTFVLKPAEQTPLSALYLESLWREAGGPTDTLQVLPALDPVPVSSVFLDDPRVRVLTFTGSTAVGISLYQRCAGTMKRLTFELGGHAPFLVFEDADLEAAVREVVACKFRNGGQTCVSTNRIYVDRRVATEFSKLLVRAVAALRVGHPLDPETQIGPLIDAQALTKVEDHVEDATRKGAKVLLGGKRRTGLYFDPTVLTDVTVDSLIMRDETFGPVAPVLTFGDEAEAVRLANSSSFGLASYLWTRDLARAYRVSESLEFGIVGVNDGVPSTAQAPLGGVKSSGLGREGGRLGLEEFLDVKYVSLALPNPRVR